MYTCVHSFLSFYRMEWSAYNFGAFHGGLPTHTHSYYAVAVAAAAIAAAAATVAAAAAVAATLRGGYLLGRGNTLYAASASTTSNKCENMSLHPHGKSTGRQQPWGG